jgi:hypothetical protein
MQKDAVGHDTEFSRIPLSIATGSFQPPSLSRTTLPDESVAAHNRAAVPPTERPPPEGPPPEAPSPDGLVPAHEMSVRRDPWSRLVAVCHMPGREDISTVPLAAAA